MTGNKTGWLFAAGAMGIAVLLPEIALAQSQVQNPAQKPAEADGQTSAPADKQDCTVPAEPSRKGNRVPKEGENLTKKLDNCNGVLQAPESGDSGIVTPAPETGNSRVIKPGDVPDSANPSNGAAK